MQLQIVIEYMMFKAGLTENATHTNSANLYEERGDSDLSDSRMLQ